MKSLVIFGWFIIAGWFCLPQNSVPTELPVLFKNNLIVLELPMGNDTLYFYTDTGGKNFLYKSGIRKLGIKKSGKNLWERSSLASHFTKAGIPQPAQDVLVYIRMRHTTYDGMLGREWFEGGTWRFDYVEKKLYSLLPRPRNTALPEPATRLFFRKDSRGNPDSALPRIQIWVDSVSLPFLFDTGAEAILSVEAQQYLSKEERVATSFVNASIFDGWKQKHPDWVVVHAADKRGKYRADLIVVPEVQIANHTVGPVEFVRREDPNFNALSRLYMDTSVVGALGGNALSKLKRFTVDYNNGLLIVDRAP